MKIYLAGKMGGLSIEEMNTWRKSATHRFKDCDGVGCINPVLHFNPFNGAGKEHEREAFQFDLHQVRGSDIILVSLNHNDSIGTVMELAIAHELRIPIIGYGCATQHPWVELCLTKHVATLNEAVDYIKAHYMG